MATSTSSDSSSSSSMSVSSSSSSISTSSTSSPSSISTSSLSSLSSSSSSISTSSLSSSSISTSSVSSQSSSSSSISTSSVSSSSSSSSSTSLTSDSSTSSSSLSSTSSSGEFGADLYIAAVTESLTLYASRRRDQKYTILMNDVELNAITIHPTNVIRIKIGRAGATPLLELVSTLPTTRGSAISNTNPVVVLLDKDDLTFAPGLYDLEIVVLDTELGNVVTSVQRGVFILFETQQGDIAAV